jgi:predicted permease
MLRNLEHAVRSLGRAPAFSAAVILTFALGIGATTAILSVVQAVFLRELPLRAPGELYFVAHGAGEAASASSTYPLFERLQTRTDVFAGVTAYTARTFKVGAGDGLELVQGQFVSGNYHALLGVPFILGRGFTNEDDRIPGGSLLAVISDGYWARRFGRRPDVIGAQLEVDGQTVTIVGVTARGFEGLDPGEPRDLTLPLSMRALENPGFLTSMRTWIGMPLVVRLRPDVAEARAAAALDVEIAGYLAEPENRDLVPEALGRFALVPGSHGSWALRDRYGRALALLAGMVGLVLLVACANVANLLLVRGAARGRDVAVRLSLGAGRVQVVRQLLAESVLLALCGGLTGMLLATWGTRFVASVFATGRVPMLIDLEPDGRVLVFAIAVSIAAGIASGLAPALHVTRRAPGDVLRGTDATPGRPSGRRAVVAAQLALCLVLVTGAGLLMRTLQNLESVEGGFRTDGLLLFTLDGLGSSAPPARVGEVCAGLAERFGDRGDVLSASCSTATPTDTSFDALRISVPGFTPGPDVSDHAVMTNIISPSYFTTLGVPFVSGRPFTDADQTGSLRVVIVSESMARHFFGMADPMGRAFKLAGREVTIVGVVADVRTELRAAPTPMTYLPLAQRPPFFPMITAALRTSAAPAALAADVRRAMPELEGGVAIDYIRTMEEQIGATLIRERLLAALSVAFGVLALVLACVGLYGVVSYDVERRTREIGIRTAVGATRGHVMRAVLGGTLLVSVAGIAVGLLLIATVAPAAINTLGADYLYGTTPRDLRVVTATTLLLALTALLAGYIPARRAAALDPCAALRVE